MPLATPLISLSLISSRGASNRRSNGPTAPCMTSRARSWECGPKSSRWRISAGSTRRAPNSVECLPSNPKGPSPAFASTLILWHRKFSNSTSTACAWQAYRRGEPLCFRDAEGLLRVRKQPLPIKSVIREPVINKYQYGRQFMLYERRVIRPEPDSLRQRNCELSARCRLFVRLLIG